MKTNEQIKTEVLNYLNKSSKHLFTIGDVEHKVIVEGDFYIIITGNNVSIKNIDNMIGYYVSNTKCVIKHQLFLTPRYYNQEIKTIKYYKESKLLTQKIQDSIKGKKNIEEIKSIIKNILS
jgi:hypothetical protein